MHYCACAQLNIACTAKFIVVRSVRVLQSSMWHEARKQEKKLREAMIDYQRRAERRREHYAKMVSKEAYDSK